MTDPHPGLQDCLAQLKTGTLPLARAACALELDGLAFVLPPAEGLLPEPLHLHGVLTERLEDLQLVHGLGPSNDAAQQGRPVLVSDLADVPPELWLGLVPDMARLGVAAVFSFPIRLGPVNLGAFTGHRTTARALSPRQLNDAVALTRATAQAALRRPDWLTDLSRLPFAAVHQAAGYLAAQWGLPPQHAWLRVRSHALTHDQPLLRTAHEALCGHLLLDGTD